MGLCQQQVVKHVVFSVLDLFSGDRNQITRLIKRLDYSIAIEISHILAFVVAVGNEKNRTTCSTRRRTSGGRTRRTRCRTRRRC